MPPSNSVRLAQGRDLIKKGMVIPASYASHSYSLYEGIRLLDYNPAAASKEKREKKQTKKQHHTNGRPPRRLVDPGADPISPSSLLPRSLPLLTNASSSRAVCGRSAECRDGVAWPGEFAFAGIGSTPSRSRLAPRWCETGTCSKLLARNCPRPITARWNSPQAKTPHGFQIGRSGD